MRLLIVTLGFVTLIGGMAWLAFFNPNNTSLRLSPDLSFEVPLVALILTAMAVGGFLAILVAGFSQFRGLLSGWRHSKEKKRSDRVLGILQQGINAKALKRYDEARGLFQKLLLMDPNHVGALIRLGDLHRFQGNVTEAIRLHRKARGLEEKNIEIFLALAKDFEQAQRLDDAVQLLEEVQRLEGANLTVLVRLRDLFVKLDRWDGAHNAQEKILQGSLSPDELKTQQEWLEGIRYEFGCLQLKEGEIDRARRYFRKIIKLNADFIPAHIGLGEILVGEGKLKQAGELWEKALETNGSVILLHRLEDLYLELGEPVKIINIFQEALRRDPENPVLRFYLGKLYYRLEMVDEAFEILTGLDPGDDKIPDLHKLLGNLYLRKGETESAVEAFKKALNLRKRVMVPYYCPLCDYHTTRWSGRCPRCGEWNSFEASPIMGSSHPSKLAAKTQHA